MQIGDAQRDAARCFEKFHAICMWIDRRAWHLIQAEQAAILGQPIIRTGIQFVRLINVVNMFNGRSAWSALCIN